MRSTSRTIRRAAVRDLVANADGPALIEKSLQARPDDPALEFAAALIMADKDRAAYERHAAKARAGASRDPLLARNIGHVFVDGRSPRHDDPEEAHRPETQGVPPGVQRVGLVRQNPLSRCGGRGRDDRRQPVVDRRRLVARKSGRAGARG